MTPRHRSMVRAAAGLASAIREGDAAGVDRSQREVVRLERDGGPAPQAPVSAAGRRATLN